MHASLGFLYIGRNFQIFFWLKLSLREFESSFVILKLIAQKYSYHPLLLEPHSHTAKCSNYVTVNL